MAEERAHLGESFRDLQQGSPLGCGNAAEYRERCSQYDEDRLKMMQLCTTLEDERNRWLLSEPLPAWAPKSQSQLLAATLKKQQNVSHSVNWGSFSPPTKKGHSHPARNPPTMQKENSPQGDNFIAHPQQDFAATLLSNRSSCSPSPSPSSSASLVPAASSPSSPSSSSSAISVTHDDDTDHDNESVLSLVNHHLHPTAGLHEAVASSFRAECEIHQNSLKLPGLLKVASSLCRALDLPKRVFSDMEDEYRRFDFNGDHTLQEHECFRLVRHHLREYRRRKQSDQQHSPVVDLPFRTPEAAGYKPVKTLGQGAQGVCYLADLPWGTQHCIKSLRKDSSSSQLRELKDELHLLQQAHNKHIMRIVSIFQDDSHFYLVSEPCLGPDLSKLRTVLRKRRDEQRRGRREEWKATAAELAAGSAGEDEDEDWWRDIVFQSLDGLRYMHQHALMHCDIKETNMMLRTQDLDHPEVVFIDFGLAQQFAHAQVLLQGTPGYIPPETWRKHKWYPKGDVFSLAVTLLQLLADRPGLFTRGARPLPWKLLDIEAFTASRPLPADYLPPNLAKAEPMLERALERDMESRPTALQLLGHGWLQGARPRRTTSAVFPTRSAAATASANVELFDTRRQSLDDAAEPPNVTAAAALPAMDYAIFPAPCRLIKVTGFEDMDQEPPTSRAAPAAASATAAAAAAQTVGPRCSRAASKLRAAAQAKQNVFKNSFYHHGTVQTPPPTVEVPRRLVY